MKLRIPRWLNRRPKADPFQAYCPTPLYEDDTFLVSYPKSGNTWVRFLLAHLIHSSDQNGVDFNTIQSIIPEVIRNDDVIATLPRPRIMKSHGYRIRYPRLIYILRDARDVYVSYYFYRRNRLPEGTSFRDFLALDQHYPCRWGEHVQFWLQDSFDPQTTLIVRYEDLIHNCEIELQRMVKFLNLDVSYEMLQGAIARSSFHQMRQIELERGRPYQAQEGADLFVREGKVGGWREFFGEEEKQIFNEREGNLLVKFGYAKDLNW
jgi:hypothetical protein